MRGSDRIEIGGVARAHGIRGEVSVALHDNASQVLDHVEVVWLAGASFTVERARPGPHGWLLKLAGVDDRNRAETLRGAPVEVARDAVPLDEDEILLDDLIGCQVRRTDGSPWGEIVAIDVGPQDRLVIHDGDLER